MTSSRLKSGVSSVTPGGNTGVARVTRTSGTPPSSSLSSFFVGRKMVK